MVTFDSKQCPATAQNEMQQALTFARRSECEVEGKLSIRETRNSSISVCFGLFLNLNFSLSFLFCSLILLLVSCLFCKFCYSVLKFYFLSLYIPLCDIQAGLLHRAPDQRHAAFDNHYLKNDL